MGKEKVALVWPEWEVEEQLGKGSYGTVYKAVRKDSNIQSHAAIKVISIPTDSSEVDSLRSEGLSLDGAKTYFKGIVEDFVGEIRLMESLKGVQNIVSVEDYKVVERTEELGWDIYIRMELLTPFNTYIQTNKLSEKDVVKLGVDICTALELCGQRDIVHRDIKPENIFINDFGYFKLGDFGIARKLENATGGLSQKGTYNYMAPEVATGTRYDARVDLYSLGIVLYRLLNNNRLPFIETEQQLLNPNERKTAVERRIRGDRMNPPSQASAQVAAVIMRACAYNPEARFANATEMKEALTRASLGAYIEEVDLDKTVSVRHAAKTLDHTVRLQQQPVGGYAPQPAPQPQGMGGYTPVQRQPVPQPPVRPAMPVQQPVNRTVPPVQQPVNRTVPPVQQPVNRTAPPVQQPVNRTVPPVQQPVNRTVPPVQQPVNRTVPPVQQPMNRTAPPTYYGAPAPAATMNRSGNTINYHQNGMQTNPAAKNSYGIAGILLSLLPILLIFIAIFCDEETALIFVGISLVVSLFACLLSGLGIGKAKKCNGNGKAPAVLGLLMSLLFTVISLILVILLVGLL